MPTPDHDESKPRRPWPFYVAVFVLLVPVAYVLSIGPAVWLVESGYAEPDTFRTMYKPLEWFEAIPSFPRAVLWYLRLWVDIQPD